MIPVGPEFATGLDRWSARTALIAEDGTSLSYAELAIRADAFADALPDHVELIAIEAAREIDVVVAYIGALRRGIAALMYDAGPKAHHLLATFAPDAIFARTPGGTFALDLRSAPPRAMVHPDLALLLSTSGSTGSAKLVRLSKQNLAANAASIVEYLGITPDDITITSLPLSYSFGLSVLHSYLNAGASLLVSDIGLGDPRFVELAARHEITSLSGVPTSYELLERSGTLAQLPSSVKALTQAGGKLNRDAVLRIHAFAKSRSARFFVMYGQTEATARIAFVPPEMLEEHPDCIGRAIPGGRLSVEDEQDAVPLGQIGELVYSGPNVMMGYALSRDDLALDAGSPRLRTGDLGVEVSPGFFRIEGRLSRFIKPLGLRVSLDELENTALRAGVHGFAAGDDRGAVLAVATATQHERVGPAIAALGLPPGMVEIVVREVPLLANGKPDYARILANARAKPPVETTASTLERLRATFQIYGRSISDETRFEDLASDSLSYINTSIAVEDALGFLPRDWQQRSLRELADLADDSPAIRSRLWARLDSDMFLRAAAISLVVIGHALTGMQGAADALLLLAGFGWARFQRKRLLDCKFTQAFWGSLGKLLIVYELIVIAYSLYKGEFFQRHAFFYSTWFADWGGLLNIYWFIQCLVWLTIVLVALHAVPPLRRYSARRPVQSGFALLGLAFVLRIAGATLVDPAVNAYRTPDQLLIYFVGGWLIALGDWRVRFATACLLVGASVHAWGLSDSHWPIMASACVLLTLVPSIWLPRPLAWAMRGIGRYGLYIYLAGAIPMWLTDEYLNQRHGDFWWLHMMLAFGLGIAIGLFVERNPAFWRRGSDPSRAKTSEGVMT